MFNKSKKTKKVVNRELIDDKSKKGRPSSVGNGFYYSFLTVILLLCLVQITISAVLNISKIVSYKAKILQITKTRDDAQNLNELLKDNIKHFSKVDGLEAIARNNLKMSGEDEVLIIINTPKDEEITPKQEKFSLFGIKKSD